jgi:hypothetical protein
MGAALSDFFVTVATALTPAAAALSILVPVGIGLGLMLTPIVQTSDGGK